MQYTKENWLGFEEAEDMIKEVVAGVDENDEGSMELWHLLCEKAVSYASVRGHWYTMTQEERNNEDDYRTALHDSFIAYVNATARHQGNPSWRERLGNDRKKIGDFACYLALHQALVSR